NPARAERMKTDAPWTWPMRPWRSRPHGTRERRNLEGPNDDPGAPPDDPAPDAHVLARRLHVLWRRCRPRWSANSWIGDKAGLHHAISDDQTLAEVEPVVRPIDRDTAWRARARPPGTLDSRLAARSGESSMLAQSRRFVVANTIEKLVFVLAVAWALLYG